jgi:hypothetical protein
MKYQSQQKNGNLKSRKHLNADALFKDLHKDFSRVSDCREDDVHISMADALMSGFAMFSLKDPSLLAFDDRRGTDGNLRNIYHIEVAPSDTQMRTILDEANPDEIRIPFKNIFRVMQRGKVLEPMVFFERCYLLSLDGTGYFSSKKIFSDSCLKKVKKKTGEITYHQQMLGAAIVHPDFKEVIPLAPEFIIKQDGQSKNDCERNAAKRFFRKLRKDHPHLPLIITEDALSSNAPHIKEAEKYNLHYILGVKKGDHPFLFRKVEEAQKNGETTQFDLVDKNDPQKIHRFLFLNQVPLNASNQDLLINFLEYWEITPKKTQHFSWITDFTITKGNAYELMRGGRARWKVENETFNTLKNQGYHFGHNYGLGKKNLSVVFVMLMMLAFLVDQTQQISCPLFRRVWHKLRSKRELWDRMRSLFRDFAFKSMRMLYEALLYGMKFQPPIILYDST